MSNTQILPNGTMLMEQNDTLLMSKEVEASNIYVNLGTVLNNKYILEAIISDSTGEAAIFVASKGDEKYVAKVYHANKKTKDEITSFLKNCNSKYITKVLDSGFIGNRYFEIFIYYKNGDLEKNAPIDEKFIMNVVVPDINEGLREIHSQGIVHRDIKPNNIFYNEDKTSVVIGDFGISSILDAGTVRQTSNFSTLGYAPPEAIIGGIGFISKESDYYSLGMTLLYLSIGTDVFSGMTAEQTIKAVITDKLNIPENLNPRLTHLVKGLTCKERKDRWGYEKVKMWCEGEYVEVREAVRRLNSVKPYIFNGKEYEELDALAIVFANHWEDGKKHLLRKYISQHLIQYGQDLASFAKDCEEEKNKDLALFKVINHMYPNIPLYWKGENLQDIYKFLEAIDKEIPSINNNCLTFLTSGALAYYLKKINASPKLISKVSELEVLAKKDSNKAYYTLYFKMSKNKNLKFKNESFDTIDEFINYLYQEKDNIIEISSSLMEDKYFYAWLEELGFQHNISNWKSLFNMEEIK